MYVFECMGEIIWIYVFFHKHFPIYYKIKFVFLYYYYFSRFVLFVCSGVCLCGGSDAPLWETNGGNHSPYLILRLCVHVFSMPSFHTYNSFCSSRLIIPIFFVRSFFALFFIIFFRMKSRSKICIIRSVYGHGWDIIYRRKKMWNSIHLHNKSII